MYVYIYIYIYIYMYSRSFCWQECSPKRLRRQDEAEATDPAPFLATPPSRRPEL